MNQLIRTFHRSAAILALLGWLAGAIGFSAEAKPPHLVLFLADDLGWGDCKLVNPETEIATPNMDRLAKGGMTFTQAFVASPSCAPSRGALLTGMQPVRNGAMFNHTVPRPKIKKWPAYFQELGYEVAAIGKVAHYATVRSYGFDHFSHFKYHEDDCIDAAVKWVEERKSDKPLCLIVGTNWPHVPWPKNAGDGAGLKLDPRLVDTPETRAAWAAYSAAVRNADRDLGKIYDLAVRVLGGNTLFVFTSDHGSQFPFGKWNCYDAGIRTPLVAVWPGKIAPGTKSEALISWIDLLPTFIEAAGGKAPGTGLGAGQICGRSFLPVLRGERDSHRDEIFTTHSGDGKMNTYPIRSVRTKYWKYIRNLDPEREHHTHVDQAEKGDGRAYWDSWLRRAENDPEAAAVIRRYHRRPAEELYDLRVDPHEQKNLATEGEHAAKLGEMRGKLDAWMAEYRDTGADLKGPPAQQGGNQRR